MRQKAYAIPRVALGAFNIRHPYAGRGRFLVWKIFIKTIVDGGNDLLKDVLFLLDEQGWHIVWSFGDLCLQQHFSLTNVDQDDFPQFAQGFMRKDETMPPMVIASCCGDTGR